MEDRPDEMSVVENLRAHGLIIDGKDIQIPADHFGLKTNKPFDQDLFDRHNNRGIQAWTEYLRRVCIYPNPDKFGPDIIVSAAMGGYYEVEVKTDWPGGPFPFPNLRIPYRKNRIALEYRPLLFVVLSNDLQRALTVPARRVLKSPVVGVDNEYLDNEPFFVIALTDTREVILE